MKGFTKALAIGTLIVATQSAIGQSAIPTGSNDGERGEMAPLSTYADAHANDPVTVSGSPIPTGSNDGERGEMPALSTYADAHANDPVTVSGSPIPTGSNDGERGESPTASTYADRFNLEPQLTGTTFPSNDSSAGE